MKIRKSPKGFLSSELQLEAIGLLVEALTSSDSKIRAGAMNLLSKLAADNTDLAPFVFDALHGPGKAS